MPRSSAALALKPKPAMQMVEEVPFELLPAPIATYPRASWLVLGIDPGSAGAIALIDGPTGRLLDVIDIPVIKVKRLRKGESRGSRTEVQAAVLAAALRPWLDRYDEAVVWLEQMGNRKNDGKLASSGLFEAYGKIQGVLATLGVTVRYVTPQKWKKWARILGDENGDLARKRAGDLFPVGVTRWVARCHHNRAEACLIGAYGRNQMVVGA